jgi:hypothetical protein
MHYHSALIETITSLRHVGSARTTQKTTDVIRSQRLHWRVDCCVAVGYNIRPLRHIFHCCTLERVYRAVA